MRRILLSFFLAFSFVSSFSQFSGNALDFDGANDQVILGSVPTLFSNMASSDFTIEMWLFPRAAVFSRAFFAQPSTSNFVTVSPSGTNQIYFYVIVNGTTHSVATTSTMPLNQWTHVACRWTAATLTPEVFFNGVLQPSVGGGGSSNGTSGMMTLGTRPGGAQFFTGAMDELRVWSVARSNCKIQANMNRNLTGPQPNLLLYYDFNQGVGGGSNAGVTNLPDLSASVVNGTLTNFALTGGTSNWITSSASVTTSGNDAGGVNITASAAVCSGASYTFPNGTTQSNIISPITQVSTIPGPGGCDSVITTQVSVNPTYNNSDSAMVCSGGNYTFPDGTTQTNITSPMIYTSALQTIVGCDSIIITYLDIAPSYVNSETASVCSGGDYTFPDGTTQTNITSTTIYTSLLQTSFGCDSIIITTVDVNPTYTNTESASVCSGGDYTFPDGTTHTNITSTAIYTSLLQSNLGCDSIIVTTVSVNTVDVSVTVGGASLAANQVGATYQWLDCNAGFSPISGATSQVFTPPLVNGFYAVVVTLNGCTDTSACETLIANAVEPNAMVIPVTVFPNPTDGILHIVAEGISAGKLELFDVHGKLVREAVFTASSNSMDLSDLSNGLYLLKLVSDQGAVIKKIWKD